MLPHWRVAPALDQLRSVVPPQGVSPACELDRRRTTTRLTLPDDHRELVCTYGAGGFDGFLGILRPCAQTTIRTSPAHPLHHAATSQRSSPNSGR